MSTPQRGRLNVSPDIPTETAHSLDSVREALKRRYRVEREIARSPTGAWYLAYETRRERPVMIRVLAPHLAENPGTREAFVRAAKAAMFFSVLLVRVRKVDETGGIVYVVMDYVGWETLAQRVCRQGPLTVGQATRMLHDVARVVDDLHVEWRDGRIANSGMIHGDLSPDNILISRKTGRAMLVMDPGAACVRAGSEADRAAYRAARAPFISPEQVKGAPADARSDVYALGVTAYFAVTGHLPFDGDTAEEVFIKHVTERAPGFRLYNEHGDGTFGEAVRTCLAKDPVGRFENAYELARRLERAPEIEGPPVPGDVAMSTYRVTFLLEDLNASPLLAAGALLVTVTAVAAAEWRVVILGGLILAWMPACCIYTVLAQTRSVLAKGYSGADMVNALRAEAARQRKIEASFGPPWLSARRRRVIYGALGLLGVAAASPFAGAWPPGVGWLAIVLGIVTALTVGGSVIDDFRASHDRIARFWLAVWNGRVGDWIMRLAGWRIEPPATPPADAIEIRKLHEPSFEYVRDVEATRDMVNLAPAMKHQVASRINNIRARLNAGEEAPPLDPRRAEALEQCLELLTHFWHRVHRWELGDSEARLVAEFEAAKRACEIADALLDAASVGGSSRPGAT
jgi:hypothetical protein